MDTTRIAVVGAGLGGLACARVLQLHGRSVTVFEREPSRHARSQGGMLDLHRDTGQAAVRATGLFDQFQALARPEAQEQRAVDPLTAELLRHDQPVETDDYAPEIDRGQLRDMLLDSLAEGTVQWGHTVTGVTSLSEDFDLVVGADGAWSRIRPAVSDTVPTYSGTTFVETYLDDIERRPALARLVGNGTMVTVSQGKALFAQRNSGGHVRVYAHLGVPIDWHVTAGLDFSDTEAIRNHLLRVFNGWHDDLLGLLLESDGGFVNRPLHVLPIGHAWEHRRGVTLLGDAAHLMPPVGIGANLAMLDGTDLAEALVTHAEIDDAVRAYESVMIPRSTAAAQACADLEEVLDEETPIDVDAIRRQLNERILHPTTSRD